MIKESLSTLDRIVHSILLRYIQRYSILPSLRKKSTQSSSRINKLVPLTNVGGVGRRKPFSESLIFCIFVFLFFLSVDSTGLRAIDKPIFKEPFSRHRAIMNLYEK